MASEIVTYSRQFFTRFDAYAGDLPGGWKLGALDDGLQKLGFVEAFGVRPEPREVEPT